MQSEEEPCLENKNTSLESNLSQDEEQGSKKTKCPFEDCNTRCHEKDLNEHKANCNLRAIGCPQKCGKTIVWNAVEHHVEYECVNGSRRCPRCGKQSHDAEKNHDCVEYLLSSLANVHQVYQGMECEIQALKQSNSKSEQEIETLRSVRQENSNMKEEIYRLRKENNENKKKMEASIQYMQENETLQKEVVRLRQMVIEKNQMVKRSTFSKQSWKTEMERLLQVNAEQQETVEKSLVDKLKLQIELERLQQVNAEQEQTIEESLSTKDDLQMKVESLTQENVEQKRALEKSSRYVAQLQMTVRRLRQKNASRVSKHSYCVQQEELEHLREENTEMAKDLENNKRIIEYLKIEVELLERDKDAQDELLKAERLEQQVEMSGWGRKRKR